MITTCRAKSLHTFLWDFVGGGGDREEKHYLLHCGIPLSVLFSFVDCTEIMSCPKTLLAHFVALNFDSVRGLLAMGQPIKPLQMLVDDLQNIGIPVGTVDVAEALDEAMRCGLLEHDLIIPRFASSITISNPFVSPGILHFDWHYDVLTAWFFFQISIPIHIRL